MGARGRAGSSSGTSAGGKPPPVGSPLSHHEKLIAAGGSLAVADGCSTCHLEATSRRLGPSFTSFAGHRVRLANGRTVLVNEAFVKRTLEHPDREPLAGYDPRLMSRTMKRLHVHSTGTRSKRSLLLSSRSDPNRDRRSIVTLEA